MTLIIESENKDFIKGLKSLAKATNAKVRIKGAKSESKKGGALKEAIREVRNNQVIKCKDFAEYKRLIDV